jgi:hypothetical protein
MCKAQKKPYIAARLLFSVWSHLSSKKGYIYADYQLVR